MNINQINAYSVNPYSNNTNNQSNSEVSNDNKTDKVSTKHHHHGHHSKNTVDASKNVQSNGTDAIEISQSGVDAVNSGTPNVNYGQTYTKPNVYNTNIANAPTATPEVAIKTEE